jgi:hypothetical protein
MGAQVRGRYIFSRAFRTSVFAISILACLGGCQSPVEDGATGAAIAPEGSADPARSAQLSSDLPKRIEPTPTSVSDTSRKRPPGFSATSVEPVKPTRAALPKRKVERHVLAFYAPSVKVYDKPYGKLLTTMAEGNFPRVPGKDGPRVPVYASNNAYVEVPLPDGKTGWVPLELVKVEAVPCDLALPTTPGPIGAGSASVDCERR